MTSDSSGWFCYSPLDPSSHAAGSPERRASVAAGGPAAETVAEVHVYLATFDPGQTQISFTGPDDVPKGDVLRAAIRELESAAAIFSE